MSHWLHRYALAFLVLLALACASYLAGSAAVPHPVPDFALQAPEIYRLEIGAAFFVAFYLATLAVVLALGGKGFAELGPRGLKAQQVVEQVTDGKQQQALSRHLRTITQMGRELEELHSQVDDLQESFRSAQQHLERPNSNH